MDTEVGNTGHVLVLGAAFNTDNMGVGALASGAISILSRRYPDAEICFLDYGHQPTVSTVYVDGKRLQVPLINLRFSWKIFLRNNIVYLLSVSGLMRLPSERFSRRLSRKNQWINAIRDAELAVAVSGGDSFSDIYGLGRFFYVYLPQLLVLSLGTKLVLLPQTIGPFRTGLARRLAGQLMRRAERTFARDRAGVRDAQAMLGSERERARFCYDLGFILEPRRPRRQDDLEDLAALKRDGRVLVGLNISGLLLMGGYSRDNAFDLKVDYRTLTEEMIEFLVGVTDANVVLIPHVFGEHAESDSVASASIYEALKDRHAGRLARIRERYDQNEIKYLIGQCGFFVGARMHACIAALSQAIPAIGIAYSQKFLGVFETVGAGPLVADPRHLTTEQILKLINEAMGRREEISKGLRHTVAKVRRELYASLEGIAS
jgi:colanic acid/amylovoran biosynthesis protein